MRQSTTKMPTIYSFFSFFALNSSRQSIPIMIIKNERQASLVNIARRISLRLANNGCSWSAGICDMACISLVDT